MYDNEEEEEEASRPVCVVAGDDDGLSAQEGTLYVDILDFHIKTFTAKVQST